MITVPEEDDDSALQQTEIQSFSITLLTMLLLLLFMYVCMYRVGDVSPILFVLLYHF